MSNKPLNPAIPAGAVFVDIRSLLPQFGSAEAKPNKDKLREMQEAMGYRRFAQCFIDCKKPMKIHICFFNNDKSCDKTLPTHTHLDCDCQHVKLDGAVQLATKKDRKTEAVVTATANE